MALSLKNLKNPVKAMSPFQVCEMGAVTPWGYTLRWDWNGLDGLG